MYNFVFSRCAKYAWLASLSLLLCACSPRFDWREVTGSEQPYQVLMPAKPASMSRVVQLAGQQLSMHMLAAEAGQISFAVGSVQVAEPGQAGLIAKAMREGMLANLRAKPEQIQTLANGNIIASGSSPQGQPLKMAARFIIDGKWVYQLVAIGPEQALQDEVTDNFLQSFKVNKSK